MKSPGTNAIEAENEAKKAHSSFDEHEVIHELKHFLPAQAPLKDFIHHNTLHAFQNLKFYTGIRKASEMFGYKVSLSLDEYRDLYHSKRINHAILDKVIAEKKSSDHVEEWKKKLIKKKYDTSTHSRIGALRGNWKSGYTIEMDVMVHSVLFRVLCSYLDQGVSIWSFPVNPRGLLSSIREIERNSPISFFRKERAKNLFLRGEYKIEDLLKILVGDESLYKQYLFDQQFAHQGWSGMVSTVEDQPQTLLDKRKISLKEVIIFELLLEIDALDSRFGEKWKPLAKTIKTKPQDLFGEVKDTELNQVLELWQQAFEWSYYDQVLAGISMQNKKEEEPLIKSFQSMFCIDDREISLRRYLEELDPGCETFGTPGFFNVEFYFKPEFGRFHTKLCPAPVTPKYLIRESATKSRRKKEVLVTKLAHTIVGGWIISQTLGFWSVFKLTMNIFRPETTPTAASSFKHMDKSSRLSIENVDPTLMEAGLQVGFTVDEMAQRVEGLLRSIALVKDFAPLVYVIGHGSSSANNPHYAAYDCGACCGRPGSVNARVFSFMGNHIKVREILSSKGIDIPETTQFVGGLHDTTRDEISFFDENLLSPDNLKRHQINESVFNKALDSNAKERSRRFESIDTKLSAEQIHDKIKIRSVSIFEPRPELNHATNTLCIVGRRSLSKDLFLDRRAFLNSYDYSNDLDGKILFNVMKPVGPVCGGINLEYYFSRVDNHKLGAGTKLPHNVMGLFGVANGIEGDLRPGLPSQMIEVHDPLRLLVIVEHFPEVVLNVIKKAPEVYEWYINEWVNIVAVHPETRELYLFKEGEFVKYNVGTKHLETVSDIIPLLESSQENFPVYLL
jgi:uncharacterized protein YbcC (UPF0753/DUF2309 family)